MKNLRFTLSILCLCSFISIVAQQYQWSDHLPYKNVISVTASYDRIYCATPYSLFYFVKADNSVHRLTRISGLSDMDIAKIGFNKDYNTLLIAYINTRLDLKKGESIINIDTILKIGEITPEDRVINNLLFIDSLAYVSCGFGIAVIDLKNEEFVGTYYIGSNNTKINVLDLACNDNFLFAATESGIYTASIDTLAVWTKDMSVPHPNATYNSIAIADDRILINKHSGIYSYDTLYYYENGGWYSDPQEFPTEDIVTMKVMDDKIYIAYKYFAHVRDLELNKIETIWTYNYQSSPVINDIIEEDNIVWIADGNLGLVRKISENNFTFIYPNGPDNAHVFDMSSAYNKLWTVPGGRDSSWNNIYKPASISSFIEDNWHSQDKEDIPAFDSIYDISVVTVNPNNPAQVFVGSWWSGMVEFNNGQLVQIYNPENSGLDYKNNEMPRCKVGGITFDQAGILWATSSHANNILSVRIPNGSLGEWYSYNLGNYSSSADIGQIMIDSYGQKWIQMRYNQNTNPNSIIVFSDSGTIDNPNDDQIKLINSAVGQGNLPGHEVYSMREDKDGYIWVGTDQGIGVFKHPENIFEGNFDCEHLAGYENVTAIEVDGDNKKWIGTSQNGIYQLSADGDTVINHFTFENSPLFSNMINCIDINQNGEVFIGTVKGIISVKQIINDIYPSVDSDENFDVSIFPNPTSENLSVDFVLAHSSEIRIIIADILGKVVIAEDFKGEFGANNKTIYLGNLTRGVYLMNFKINHTSVSKKLLKL
jgi:ligand-binding sensor domain-containing protein